MENFLNNPKDKQTLSFIEEVRKCLQQERELKQMGEASKKPAGYNQQKKNKNLVSSGFGEDEAELIENFNFDTFLTSDGKFGQDPFQKQPTVSQNQQQNQQRQNENRPSNQLPMATTQQQKNILSEIEKNLQSGLIPENDSPHEETSERSSNCDEEETDIQDGQDQQIVEVSKEPINKEETQFRIKYSNGDIYEGEIDQDTKLKDGWGTYFYVNGERYEGIFQDDLIEGMGRYYFLGGHEYEGEWTQGRKEGPGILKFSNGGEYRGDFVNDNYHGEGQLKYPNGDVYVGEFKNGLRHGQGKFKGAGGKNGRVMIGQWENDELII